MKEAIQDLTTNMYDNEITLEGSKSVFKVSKAQPTMITYSCVLDLEK